jgi:AsmA protein
MPRVPRLVVRVALGIAALLVAALALLAVWLDPGAHKARIEQAASNALGLEVSVDGPLALRWRPTAYLVLRDVRARKRGADIVAAREAVLGIEWISLLRGQPKVHSVALHDGVFAIVRERDGRLNFQKERVPGARPERDGPDITFSGATITYADPRFERRVEARACRGDIRQVHLAGGERRFLASVSFEGRADCGELRAGGIALADVSLSAIGKQGVIEFQPVRARLFDAPASGRLQADFTGAVPVYQIESAVQRFAAEQLLKALSLREVASGRIDLSAKLLLHGGADIRQSIRGTVSLRGQGLVYHGADLDAQFERFESTQNFNLFDVGAVLLAGPAGLLVTKGYEMASAAQEGAQGKSEIRLLVSDWVIERGVARTRDVAMATPANRVALKGSIDLDSDRFQDMTIALVDPRGCAKVRQQVRGTLGKPVVDKPSAIETIAGPAVRLLKKGAEMIGGADACDVFYAGAVPAPAAK